MEIMEHDIKKILIPLDFSRNPLNVVNLAVQIAIQNSASLHLLHVVDSNLLGSGSAFSGKFFFHGAAILERSEKKLQNLKETIEAQANIPVVIESQVGELSAVVRDYVPNHSIDLVLMSVGLKKISHFFSTNKAYSVVSQSEVPVITVPEFCKIKELKTVIYPVREVDGVISKLNSLMPVLLRKKATVHLFGVSSSQKREDASRPIGNALKFLKVRMRRKKLEVGRVDTVTTDTPAKEILEQVSKLGPDLLAVNVTTERSLKKLFKNNFTENIISKSEVPVLFYRKNDPDNLVQNYVQIPYPMYPV